MAEDANEAYKPALKIYDQLKEGGLQGKAEKVLADLKSVHGDKIPPDTMKESLEGVLAEHNPKLQSGLGAKTNSNITTSGSTQAQSLAFLALAALGLAAMSGIYIPPI